jgi:hypothetical protein
VADSALHEWITPADAARESRRSLGTIKTWIRNGDIAAVCTLHGARHRVFVSWADVYDKTFDKPRRVRLPGSSRSGKSLPVGEVCPPNRGELS